LQILGHARTVASVQLFTEEIRVQFQARPCVILVDIVHLKMDALESCKTLLKLMPNYTASPLRR
jgi:hypothetical protein